MRRDWNLSIDIDRRAPLALSQQIAQAIIEKIRLGLLRPGEALPGTRELAARLALNRKTVVTAYDELAAQGWLLAQGKRGTFVSPQLPAPARAATPAERDVEAGLPAADYAVYGTPWTPADTAGRELIEFSDGVPDSRIVAFDALSSAFRRALIETVRGNLLGYGDPRGLLALRERIAAMLRHERGLHADAQTLCLVRGSQMGIYLAARVLVQPGDVVAIERLSYPPARAAFEACGARVVAIEQDAAGLLPEALEQLCRRQRLRAIYLTPHHQFPTTVTLPADRRLRLLALAEQFGFVIVEDDYDHEFHFAGTPLLPMASIDRCGKVMYVGSLSKVLAPGLRVGYVVAPEPVIARLAGAVMQIDRQGNAVTERAVVELFDSGELARHIRRARRIYAQRRQLTMHWLREQLAGTLSFREPDGGLALWLQLAPALDVARLQRDALAEQVGILPGSTFRDDGAAVNALRLGYGGLDERELLRGLQGLQRAILRQRPAGA